ncbi:MAG: DUF1646 family protein [Elusimicrobiota bacterium]
MLEFSLIAIVALVLVLPVTVRFIEHNLELFLLAMGALSVTFSHFLGEEKLWTLRLIEEALVEPVAITAAVAVFGLLVFLFRKKLVDSIIKIEHKLGSKLFCFALITVLGITSSMITAIMAAIILSEVVSSLRFSRDFEVKLVVLGCFSIGLGAVLTPIGEPLSTIAVSKLKGAPFHADFFFLLRNLGWYVIPGVIATGILGAIIEPSVKEGRAKDTLKEKEKESFSGIFMRAGKVYVFISALILLGAGFKPIIDKYIISLSSHWLYWINIISAVMDNATLTAAEISPQMSLGQIKYILMGLLVAGGMLIPGNIPNIISASKLGITSKEWAKIGLPLGFAAMVVYFLIFLVI